MSDLTLDQKQQRVNNLLQLGSLYKLHQIGKKLDQVALLQKTSNDLAKANLQVNSQISEGVENLNQKIDYQIYQKNLEEAEKKKIKLLRDIFFNINEEIDLIKRNNHYPLERYFLYSSLKAELFKNEIDTSITDDFNEKKIINDTLRNLDNEINILDENFNNEEKQDQEDILAILEVDEESEIKELENSFEAQIVIFLKKVEELFLSLNEQNKCWPIIFSWFLKKTDWEKIQKNDRVNIIYGPSLDLGNEIKKLFFENVLINPSKDNSDFGPIIFYKEFYHHLYKNIDLDVIDKVNRRRGSYKSETTALIFRKSPEKFYEENSNFIDTFYNNLMKSLSQCFTEIKDKRNADMNKIKSLESDIKKEKDLVKKIYAKHKFVEKILSSRI